MKFILISVIVISIVTNISSLNIKYQSNLHYQYSLNSLSNKYVKKTHNQFIMSSSSRSNQYINTNKIKSILSSPFTYVAHQYKQLSNFFEDQIPMLKYLWPRDNIHLKLYLIMSIVSLVVGKWFTLQVPFAFQRAIDTLTKIELSPNALNMNTGVVGIFKALFLTKENVALRSVSLQAGLALIYYGFSRGISTGIVMLLDDFVDRWFSN